MNRSLLFVMMLIAIPLVTSGQCDTCKVKLYFSWYSINNTGKIQSDVFTYEFADSSVTVVAKNKYEVGSIPDITDLQVIPVKSINEMSFRRKGKPGIGAIAGGITGALAGVLIGFARGSSYIDYDIYISAGFKAICFGFAWAGLGVGLGAAIGQAKTNIPINGDIENYRQARSRVQKYSIRYYTH